jgi:hypothetical protein
MNMKLKKHLLAAIFLTGLMTGNQGLSADAQPDAKAKPYPLDKCIVSDEKLDSMVKPYVFTHEGQEIKLCCKDCSKEFQKDPAKYTKKLEEEQKKAKKP